MELDNREIAFLTWFSLIGGAILWKSRRSDAARKLLCLLVEPPIVRLLGAIVCYVAISVWLLSLPSWWQWSNLKTTLLWTGSFALVAVFNYEKADSGKAYFRATMLEATGITALLSFIASSHTFGLLAELAIAFLLIALAAIVAVSERDARLKSAHTVATTLLVLLSLLMIGNSIYHIATSFDDFATLHTAREFALPMLLTAMFLPFLYGLYVYATYDLVLNSFDFSIKDPALRRYARRRLVTGFRLDTAGLGKWRRHIVMFEPKDKSDIDTSIREIRQVRRRERHPHRVPPALGWLPNHATQFLASAGLPTNDYHRGHGGWWASSRYLDIGDEMLPCNIAYYLEGEEFVVTKLKLVLNVNAPNEADRAYKHFLEVISALANAATPGALRNGNVLEIRADDAPLFVNGYALVLRRIEWPNGIPGGHELAFTIEVADVAVSAKDDRSEAVK
ncbi:hypothetical protein [Luteimonas fraxinea]|uniref:hypothetical protein n=1 Tax=Luteimonas fraxinea TaxID=2901869 RepID=UPI001E40EB6C|nr:hypothetical protein [Luteimonas fraxinea]MCD9127666.1 hypothetical protein [Luteimonas fraxinea]